MATLHIALQEGFLQLNDSVVVRVNGRQVADRQNVRTRTQIGLADAFDVEVPAGELQLEIDMPSRGLREARQVTVEGTTYVGVSVENNELRMTVQREAFRYL